MIKAMKILQGHKVTTKKQRMQKNMPKQQSTAHNSKHDTWTLVEYDKSHQNIAGTQGNYEKNKECRRKCQSNKVLRTTAKMIHELLSNMIKVIKRLRARRMIRLPPERYDLNRPLVCTMIVRKKTYNILQSMCLYIFRERERESSMNISASPPLTLRSIPRHHHHLQHLQLSGQRHDHDFVTCHDVGIGGCKKNLEQWCMYVCHVNSRLVNTRVVQLGISFYEQFITSGGYSRVIEQTGGGLIRRW